MVLMLVKSGKKFGELLLYAYFGLFVREKSKVI